MLRNAKLIRFIYWSNMISPMMPASVYANTIICKMLGIFGYAIPTLAYTTSWWQIILFILLGYIINFGSRDIKAIRGVKWYHTLLLPVFILVLTAVMAPIRLLSLIFCPDDMRWGIRKLEEDSDRAEVS